MEFVAEKFMSAEIQQEVSQYFFEFDKDAAEEGKEDAEPVIKSNFTQNNSTKDHIIKHEREIYLQYDKIVSNARDSKILKQLNDNISKKYQQLAPNEEQMDKLEEIYQDIKFHVSQAL